MFEQKSGFKIVAYKSTPSRTRHMKQSNVDIDFINPISKEGSIYDSGRLKIFHAIIKGKELKKEVVLSTIEKLYDQFNYPRITNPKQKNATLRKCISEMTTLDILKETDTNYVLKDLILKYSDKFNLSTPDLFQFIILDILKNNNFQSRAEIDNKSDGKKYWHALIQSLSHYLILIDEYDGLTFSWKQMFDFLELNDEEKKQWLEHNYFYIVLNKEELKSKFTEFHRESFWKDLRNYLNSELTLYLIEQLSPERRDSINWFDISELFDSKIEELRNNNWLKTYMELIGKDDFENELIPFKEDIREKVKLFRRHDTETYLRFPLYTEVTFSHMTDWLKDLEFVTESKFSNNRLFAITERGKHFLNEIRKYKSNLPDVIS